MDKISPELAARMAEFIRRIHNGYQGNRESLVLHDEIEATVKKLVAELPKPVDPDLIDARKIAVQTYKNHNGGIDHIRRVSIGQCDGDYIVTTALAAIKRGRELASGAA